MFPLNLLRHICPYTITFSNWAFLKLLRVLLILVVENVFVKFGKMYRSILYRIRNANRTGKIENIEVFLIYFQKSIIMMFPEVSFSIQMSNVALLINESGCLGA